MCLLMFTLMYLKDLTKKEMIYLEENCKGANMAQVILRKYRNVLFPHTIKTQNQVMIEAGP